MAISSIADFGRVGAAVAVLVEQAFGSKSSSLP